MVGWAGGGKQGTDADRISSSLHLVRLWSRIEKLTMAVFLHSPFRHGLRQIKSRFLKTSRLGVV
jgi:hypothetical protein